MAYQASRNNDFDRALELITHAPASICEKSEEGYNPFHQAGYWGKTADVIEKLGAAGQLYSARALKMRNDGNSNPVEYAKSKSHEETADALARLASSFEMQITELAKSNRFEEVFNFLEAEPTLVAARSRSGYTVLHFAGYFGKSPDIVDRLVKAGGSAAFQALEIKQKDGLTPVEYAIHKGYTATAAALRKHTCGYSTAVNPMLACDANRVICIGDVHGQASALATLWSNLISELGEVELAAATVIFLGDYCDRGPQTRAAFDYMIQLRDGRACGTTHFIAGNHDLGMAAFLGCLPTTKEYADLEWTKKPEFKSGFWQHPVAGGMHYQGRRWGGSAIYNVKSTFDSYGVAWEPTSPTLRDNLNKQVPQAHKDFLKSLKWVHEEAVSFPPGRVTCVHAGLVESDSAEAQLEALRQRDLSAKVLHHNDDPGRIAAFSARDISVENMHPELEGTSLLVSGHFGKFLMKGSRIINDRNGGCGPMEAVILPERKVIPGCTK